MRHQGHPKHAFGFALYVIDGAHDLDAAALTAPAGVNLRFHDPPRSAQLFGRGNGFVDSKGGFALWGRRPKGAQDLFGLVFLDIHAISKSWRGERFDSAALA